MFFIIFNTLAGIALITLPVYLVKKYKASWKMPKWMFVKVGLLAIVVQVFAFSVFDSLLSYFPDFLNISMVWQALLTGVFTGLFFELGRFYVLDKMFSKVRDFKSTIYFGLSWSGVSMFIIGAALLFASFGLYLLNSTSDISTLIPDSTPDQIEQLQALKSVTTGGVIESLQAFVPVFERVAFMSFDILLSLIIVFGLMQKRTSYVWASVGLRTLVSALMYFVATQSAVIGILFFVAIGIVCFYGVKRLKPFFSV